MSAGTDDLARLTAFDDASIVSLIETRFAANQIYTYADTMLLAVNPYADFGLYAPAVRRQYGLIGGAEPPPHVFAVAARACRGTLSLKNQCIIVTGESGAGKTETCRRILQYLASSDEGTEDGSTLHARVACVNCVLEAFGNAQTTMNDNSSRFGKFLAVKYGPSGQLCGANVSTYLLEKTRVVTHGKGERSYHVFYSLLGGLTPSELDGLSLGPRDGSVATKASNSRAAAFRYTSGAAADGSQPSEAPSLASLAEALRGAGLSAFGIDQIWRCLAAVLTLGELTFAGEDAAEVATEAERSLLAAAALLGVGVAPLRHALVSRCIRAADDFVSTPNSPAAATELTGGLAKALYARLFAVRVLDVINAALELSPSEPPAGVEARAGGRAPPPFIGLLDIFGFELFAHNSLEQLLINYTNEQLQACPPLPKAKPPRPLPPAPRLASGADAPLCAGGVQRGDLPCRPGRKREGGSATRHLRRRRGFQRPRPRGTRRPARRPLRTAQRGMHLPSRHRRVLPRKAGKEQQGARGRFGTSDQGQAVGRCWVRLCHCGQLCGRTLCWTRRLPCRWLPE